MERADLRRANWDDNHNMRLPLHNPFNGVRIQDLNGRDLP